MSRRRKDRAVAKVLVVGDVATGKTSFIKRACSGQFSPTYQTTIGVDFSLKSMTVGSGENLKFQLWDVAGQERFIGLARIYYRDAVAAFVTFDVSQRSSFENAVRWREDIVKKVFLPSGDPIPVFLLGNKCDLDESERHVTESEAARLQRSEGFHALHMVSAKAATGVNEACQAMAELVHANNAKVQAHLAAEQQRQASAGGAAGGERSSTVDVYGSGGGAGGQGGKPAKKGCC